MPTRGSPTTRADSDEATSGRAGPDDRYATASQRAVAYLVDVGVVVGVLLALTRRRGTLRRIAALVVGSVVGATAYHVVLEGSRGQTVGKRAVGIAVVGTDDQPCGYRAAAIRTAARVVDFLPVGYLLGLLSIRVTRRRQRIGDLAAGTVVVGTRTGSGSDVNQY